MHAGPADCSSSPGRDPFLDAQTEMIDGIGSTAVCRASLLSALCTFRSCWPRSAAKPHVFLSSAQLEATSNAADNLTQGPRPPCLQDSWGALCEFRKAAYLASGFCVQAVLAGGPSVPLRPLLHIGCHAMLKAPCSCRPVGRTLARPPACSGVSEVPLLFWR